jgi:Na+/H+-dicarboxylate symporter
MTVAGAACAFASVCDTPLFDGKVIAGGKPHNVSRLVLGVHRLLSSAFVPVNVLGNALATIVMSRWERALDVKAPHSQLHYPRPSPLKEDRNLR